MCGSRLNVHFGDDGLHQLPGGGSGLRRPRGCRRRCRGEHEVVEWPRRAGGGERMRGDKAQQGGRALVQQSCVLLTKLNLYTADMINVYEFFRVFIGEVCQNPCGTAMQGRHATKP